MGLQHERHACILCEWIFELSVYTMYRYCDVQYACNYWQDTINPREERLDIIRFFVEAGADALLYEE